jgi:hypothetical protein
MNIFKAKSYLTVGDTMNKSKKIIAIYRNKLLDMKE